MLYLQPHQIPLIQLIRTQVLQINILWRQWLFLNTSISLDHVILILVHWFQQLEQALHKELFTQVLPQHTQEVGQQPV